MRFLLGLLALTTTALAGDSHGQGKNSFVSRALDDSTTLSFFKEPDDDRLYFRLKWKRSETASVSNTGRGVDPKHNYAYYWDDSRKIFWFADEQSLQKVDLSKAKEGSTSSSASNISGYKYYEDLPPQLIPMIEALIKGEQGDVPDQR